MTTPLTAVLDQDFENLSVFEDLVVSGSQNLETDLAHGVAVARVFTQSLRGSTLEGNIPVPLAMSHSRDDLTSTFAAALTRTPAPEVITASWGLTRPFADDFDDPHFAEAGNAITEATIEGRDGLGRVLVFAAGNTREIGDDANHHNFQNAPGTITVGALDESGGPAAFSTPGAPVLLAAPGVDVTVGPLDLASTDNEPAELSGTSFAAPQVAAAAAMMLSRNPALSHRDVQDILARTATPLAESGSGAAAAARQDSPTLVSRNGAGDWNAGGLVFDPRVGFGALDTEAAVRVAAAWPATATNRPSAEISVSQTSPRDIPDGAGRLVVPMTFDGSNPRVEIEHVIVDVAVDHGWIGDLSIALRSPAGTRSVLLDRPGRPPDSDTSMGSDDANLDFTLTSARFRGEESEGTWEIQVTDHESGYAGELDSVSVTLRGAPADADDTYVFTEAYARLNAPGETRRLTDAAGEDHLMAAALSQDAFLALTPGSRSIAADRGLRIDDAAVIENATAGAGDDVVLGNAHANQLGGGKGDDWLAGGAGPDVLAGGAGNDHMTGGPGADRFVVSGGDDVILDFQADEGDRLVLPEGVSEPPVPTAVEQGWMAYVFDDAQSVTIAGEPPASADWVTGF